MERENFDYELGIYEKKLNSVNTTLIEILSHEDGSPMQCWYHYDTAKIIPIEDDIFISFYLKGERVASFGIKPECIKLERIIESLPGIPQLPRHYHILVGPKGIKVEQVENSLEFRVIRPLIGSLYNEE